MKYNLKKIMKLVMIGLSMAVVIVTSTFTIVYVSKKSADNSKLDYLEKDNKEFKVLDKSNDVPVKLIEHETGGYYFLGYDGLKLLNERIKSQLQFGPEIEGLKSIRINNRSLLEKNVSGQYNQITQEIEIEINRFIDSFKDIPLSQKVDLIFPTVFHEYGHHFSNTYITSIATNDPKNSKKLYYEYNNKSVHKNISSTFLNKFEESLHYSDTEENKRLSDDKNLVSSFKTARDIYNRVNGIEVKNNKNDFLDLDNKNFTTITPFKNEYYYSRITSSNYSYLFSIDELLTRKLQQITYIDDLNGKLIANGNAGFTGVKLDVFYTSTIASDVLKNKKITKIDNKTYQISDELILMDYPYGGTFMSNKNSFIIDPTVEKLWNAYLDISGYNFGISQIFMKNNSEQLGNNKRSALFPENFNKIKFTGYLEENKNYKGLLFMNKKENNIIVPFSNNNYKYNWLKAKSYFFSKSRDLKKHQNKFGYTTDYFDVSNINLKKPIKVWNDINKNNKLDQNEAETLSISKERPTTTFRESLSKVYEDGKIDNQEDVNGKKFYEIKLGLDNEVYLSFYDYENINKLIDSKPSNLNISFVSYRNEAILFNNNLMINNKKRL